MTNQYPYKFNVSSLEYEDVADYLRNVPESQWRIDTREMVGELTLEEWRSVKAYEAQQDAIDSGDNHQVIDLEERKALLQTDSNEKVEVCVRGLPATASRTLLNRIAIHTGVNNAGINREAWSAEFSRGLKGYLVQFANKDAAILFKLAMWKRPGEDAKP